jgi:hypothetical protein
MVSGIQPVPLDGVQELRCLRGRKGRAESLVVTDVRGEHRLHMRGRHRTQHYRPRIRGQV